MENLLPTVASIDVTSNEFRETSLPYQQWEAKRTHHAPSTPSDIGHLLPPIGGRREARRDLRGPPLVPLRIEPPLPCPAPVDRNLADLYNPGLDPSPIGKEERGIVQPVRSTRIVPRRDFGSQQSRGFKPGDNLENTTFVTILNGYSSTQPRHRSERKDATDCGEPCVDVFVQGFSKVIEHATLLPSEIFCRTLQHGQSGIPTPESPAVPGGARTSQARDSSLGLTIFLAHTAAWPNCGNTQAYHERSDVSIHAEGYQVVQNSSSSGGFESARDKVARCIFQAGDGTLAPSRSAFRVQFEPGPLGMELEEDPKQRGIVQVRQVLQTGQAEQDARIRTGFLIVAVGDWGKGPTATSASNASTFGKSAEARTSPSIVRSLAQFEECILNREPDRLFIVWAIDRKAPEVVAALGPQEPSDRTKSLRGWSSPTPSAGRSDSDGAEGISPASDGVRGRHGVQAASGHEPFGVKPSTRTTLPGHWDWDAAFEGAPAVESGRAADSMGGSRCTLSRDNKPEAVRTVNTDQANRHDLRVPRSEADLRPNPEFPFHTAHGLSSTLHAEKRPKTTSRVGGSHSAGRENFGGREDRWEFQTRGGMFDEDDQGLAARKQPVRVDAKVAHQGGPENGKPSLPLGLEASAVDDLPVFIWFCNNHESAIMQVSWTDYDGKHIPRRSLVPGACYFERSFATHPWIVQHSHSAQGSPAGTGCQKQYIPPVKGGEEENYCIVRLGDAMAAARLTGSLIWNPDGRMLSITKQVKVGTAGVGANVTTAAAAAPMEGGGLDPGKKRVCMAGADREAAAASAMTGRASVRGEKARILEEMKIWRTHPPVGAGGGGAMGGVGKGAPNLRFVMIGSSGWDRGNEVDSSR